MGRNKSIQTFLLTLTGCSWMLLFLSITLSDNHAFRKYHAARQVTHAPPIKDHDPCAICWNATPDTPEEPTPTQDTGWGARLARAMGVQERVTVLGGGDGGRVGGVGAFYYYTLHTTLTTLRLKLDQAYQVAGDVQEEVATLREKVTQLHQTLNTRFSPRQNPYHQHRKSTTTTTTTTAPTTTMTTTVTSSNPQTRTLTSKQRNGTSKKTIWKSRVFPVLALYNPPPSSVNSATSIAATSLTKQLSDLDKRSIFPAQSQYQKHRRTPRTEKDIGMLKKGRTDNDRTHLMSNPSESLDVKAKNDGMEWEKSGGFEWGRSGVMERGRSGDMERGDESMKFGNVIPSILRAKDVISVVSVVVVMGEGVEELLTKLSLSYPGITVHLLSPTHVPHPPAHQLSLHVHSLTTNTTRETEVIHILQHVVTKYVMIASEVTYLDGLENLVSAVENWGVWAVGGGLQEDSGKWRSGCLTSHYNHYEASWTRRRLGTFGGCMLCHALEGPFLALTVALRHFGWDPGVNGNARQLDLFLRASHRTNMLAAVCPAALISLTNLPQIPSRAEMLSLARRHDLYSVKVPDQPKFMFSCNEVKVSCSGGGVALPPCCRKDLAALVRYTMDTCEAHGLLCELQEGSLLGAVKTMGILPWERDADITFHTQNFSALTELKDVFERAGYSLHLTDNRWCCVGGRPAGGQGVVSGKSWRGELWSQHAMDSEDDILAGRSRTRIELDGSWVGAPSSPGQYVRNRYGVEVYRHAQHWLDTGRGSGWDEYDPGKFLQCSSPTHHACLDHQPADGNLNFMPLCLT